PHADVVAEEEHRAAAKVPRRFTVVETEHVGERIDLRANHAETRESIWTKSDPSLATDGYANQQIARRRQDAAPAHVGLAVKVRAMRDVRFEAEHTSTHVSEGHAPIEALRIDRICKWLPRVAAEIYAD